LRLLAHRASVEDDEIRVLRPRGGLGALRHAQHVGNLRRVVLVHLAAERAQVQFRHQRRTASSGVSIQTSRIAPLASRRYLTSEPASRIRTPGASVSRLPSSSTMRSCTWLIVARLASPGMVRSCGTALVAKHAWLT